MEYVLAVDGGNTKTVALVAVRDGGIVGYGRGGCGDIYNSYGNAGAVGYERSLENITEAVERALEMAGVSKEEMGVGVGKDEIVAGVFNMAGADWPEDFALLHGEMGKRGFGRVIHVQNDALGVIHTVSRENVGVSVVCGTGAAIGARGREGREWHVSFWLLGGTEGAVQLSWKALGATLRSELGVEVSSSLRERMLELFEMESVEEILHAITARGNDGVLGKRVIGLAPIVLSEADAGDELALKVVREHGYGLGTYACAAAKQVGLEGTAFPLVLAGGVLRHPTHVLADAIVERVRELSPEVQPVRAVMEPVVGALYAALEMAGVVVDDEVVGRVRETLPGRELFETEHNK